MTSITREIATLRRSLKSVNGSLRRLAPLLSAAARSGAGPAAQAKSRRRRPSAKVRAAMVLQGRYMGYMRQLKPRQKAQVRNIREAKGVRAAIARAQRLSG